MALAVVAFFVVGNLGILVASRWMGQAEPSVVPASVGGVDNLRAVDAKLWRGAAPTSAGYRSLAGAGVRTIVDLRAEDDVRIDAGWLRGLGVDLVRIPIRDGQAPTSAEVSRFLETVRDSDGTVFVHCGAGVGRTGTMAAAWLVSSGEAVPVEALRRNLAVGPPTLEQMAWVAQLGGDHTERPAAALVAASRVLDAPRRLWSRYGI